MTSTNLKRPPSPPLSLPWTQLTREQTCLGMEEFFRRILRLHKKKQSDYAAGDDGLSNFRKTASRLNLTMPQVFLVLMQKHQIALERAARSPDLELNERVEDRLFDLAAYSGLLYLALREKDIQRRRSQ